MVELLADNPAGRGQTGEEAGQLLYQLDRDAEAALTFQAPAEALREAGGSRVPRRRLMALNYADEVEKAEKLIAMVTRRYAELPAGVAEEPGVRREHWIFAFEPAYMFLRRGGLPKRWPVWLARPNGYA
ncbi:hypothetical protein [Actinoplanes siamensis]|uniref:Uncharacterized protein n=1 Tax=Actinoplanes siamensis TaxID=1223317 RepID=A0A919NDH3_9ACTN|nr:hypothetical protein [Actinoplanes siamensis]GIF08807.1 hypothetical protein Asi03nite_63450 [Actinoplanes siamensis]